MRIILSISSDIGFNLGIDWLKKGYKVVGTYRNFSNNCKLLKSKSAQLFETNLIDKDNIEDTSKRISEIGKWNVLVLAAGTMEPWCCC